MPLSKIQSDVLRALAASRSPESYVAGATPLNVNAPRFSADIDIFHDRAERLAASAEEDANLLRQAGFELTWKRQDPLIYTAEIARQGAGTRMEWVADSDFRFFPTVKDELFGYVLHPIDLAANKAQAAAGRRVLRDIIDLLTIQSTILPLGAVIWAAVEKSPGFTPEALIAEIRRNLNHHRTEWEELVSTEPLEPDRIVKAIRAALDEAEEFVLRMPTAKVGLLFLADGKVVQPDPDHLEDYETHAGQRRGHWPSSGEISSAMLEHYSTAAPPTPPSGFRRR